MTRTDLLDELRKLPPDERLALIEAALHFVREDLQAPDHSTQDRALATAAEALLADYQPGGELTIFTALDAEDFHAPE